MKNCLPGHEWVFDKKYIIRNLMPNYNSIQEYFTLDSLRTITIKTRRFIEESGGTFDII